MLATIDIHVISLPQSIERRDSVKEQFRRLGLSFAFFDAIDGQSNHPDLIEMDSLRFLLRNKRYPVPGEIGCYTSHWLLWKKCYELQRPIVIMEDDFEFSAHAEKILASLGDLSQKFPILKLEKAINSKIVRSFESYNKIEVLTYKRAPNVLMAYMITPGAAEKLLNGKEKFHYPVDAYLRNSWLHGVPVRGISPPLVNFGELTKPKQSTIGCRERNFPWWAVVPRLYLKNRNSIMTHLHNYIHNLSSKTFE